MGPPIVAAVAVLALALAFFLPVVAAPLAAGALVFSIIGWRRDRAFKWAYIASLVAVVWSLIMMSGTLLPADSGGDPQPVREPGPVVDAPLPS